MIEKKDVEFEPAEKETVKADGGSCGCTCGGACSCASGDLAVNQALNVKRQPGEDSFHLPNPQ